MSRLGFKIQDPRKDVTGVGRTGFYYFMRAVREVFRLKNLFSKLHQSELPIEPLVNALMVWVSIVMIDFGKIPVGSIYLIYF